MVGLKSGTVKLNPYDTAWPRRFRQEAARLRRYLGGARCQIEHIGSTAVPGLDAKPIIDIALCIPSFKQLPLWIRRLERAGYEYKGEYGLPGRHFFTRGTPVTQHLHLVQPTSEHWQRWLTFRDYLRANPVEAQRYNAAKQALARKFPEDRNAYTRAKTPIINRLLKRAAAWRQDDDAR